MSESSVHSSLTCRNVDSPFGPGRPGRPFAPGSPRNRDRVTETEECWCVGNEPPSPISPFRPGMPGRPKQGDKRA